MYWKSVQKGGNDRAVMTLVEEICERHALSGLIIGGLCAGAICALRPCDDAPERVKGLLLLEPNFRSTHETGPHAAPASNSGAARSRKQKFARLLRPNDLLHILSSRSRGVRLMAPFHPIIRKLLTMRVGHLLPPDALVPLVMIWQRALERNVPSLVVLAEGLVADSTWTSSPMPSPRRLRRRCAGAGSRTPITS